MVPNPGSSSESRDRPCRIDTVGLRECGARGIDRGEGAALGPPQEAVTRGGVTVESRDCTLEIDVFGEGAYGEGEGTNCARAIKLGDGAVGVAQEAVKRGVCVRVDSCNCSRRVDGGGPGTCDKAREAGGARNIKRDEGPGFGRSVRERGCLLSVLQAFKITFIPSHLLKNGMGP
jgi:hypothetical protein